MAAKNAELRVSTGVTFGGTDQLVYLKSHWNLLDGIPLSFTPVAHTHGNISDDGKIGTTANLAVITTTNGVLTTLSRSGIDTRTSFTPASHASTDTSYGVGTNANYGHTKIKNTLTESAYVDGEALSAYQGKVLNDAINARKIAQVNYVSADVTVSLSSTYVTAASVTYEAGKYYHIRFFGSYSTVATTTGIKLIGSFNAVGMGAYATGTLWGAISQSTGYTGMYHAPFYTMNSIYTNGNSIVTTGVSTVNSKHPVGLDIIVYTGSSGGTFSIKFATEVNASDCTIRAGSALMIQELTSI